VLRLIIAIVLFVFAQSLSAQNLHSKNKKAIESFYQAQELSKIGNLFESESLLQAALKRDKSFDEAILLLHQVYLRRDQFQESKSVLAKYRSSLAQTFINRVLSDQANYQYELGNYKEAASYVADIEGAVYGLPERIVSILTQSIDFAMDQMANAVPIEFEELPKPINEFDRQYFPSITFSEQLVFTVRENKGSGGENIYTSTFINGTWTKPEPISGKINTDRNEGTASVSLDGSTLVFTACNLPDNIGSCDLYVSYFQANDWTAPELLSDAVNSPNWDSQPSLSRDGSMLYFVSRRPGGMGGGDIWVSSRTDQGWSPAINLGAEINTMYDDISPYIYADSRTLFFASKGRLGMGGLDLFVSNIEGGRWSEPKNLGYPINNAFDQVGYSVSPQGWAYYSSTNETGRITINRFKVPKEVFAIKKIALIEAIVLDETTRLPINASVVIYDGPDSSLVNVSKQDGLLKLFYESDSIHVKVESEGYLTQYLSLDDLLNLPERELLLSPVKPGESIAFEVINFDLGSADIRPSSYPVLNTVVKTILDNPQLLIEVGGHTDKIGEGIDNLTLSIARARSVYFFLIEKGVTKENLVFKGYGEDRPLKIGNSAIVGNQNRRIEFKVLGFLK